MYVFYKRRIKGKNQYIDISLVLWLLSHYFIVKPDQAFPTWQWDYSNRDTWNAFVQSNRLLKRMKESQGFYSFFANGPIKFKIWLWDLSDRPLGKQPSKFWILLTFFLLRKKIIIRWSSRHTVMNLLCKSWICWWF